MYKFIHEKSTSALSYGYLCLRFFIFGCCLLRVIIIQSVHLFQLFTKEIVLEQNTLATSIENPKQERYAFLHWTVWSESDGLISKALCQKLLMLLESLNRRFNPTLDLVRSGCSEPPRLQV